MTMLFTITIFFEILSKIALHVPFIDIWTFSNLLQTYIASAHYAIAKSLPHFWVYMITTFSFSAINFWQSPFCAELTLL